MKNLDLSLPATNYSNLFLAVLVIAFVFFNMNLRSAFAIPEPEKANTETAVAYTESEGYVDELASFDSKELSANIKYPEIARKMGIQGRVIAKVLVTKEGKAKTIEILESADEMFEKPAIQAINQLTFEPGKKNGNPIESWISIPVDFVIQK